MSVAEAGQEAQLLQRNREMHQIVCKCCFAQKP